MVIVLLFICFFVAVTGQLQEVQNTSDYVQVQNGQFVQNCQPIHFLGWDSYKVYDIIIEYLEQENMTNANEMFGQINTQIRLASEAGYNLMPLRLYSNHANISNILGQCDGDGMIYIDYILSQLQEYDMYAVLFLSAYTWGDDEDYPGTMRWFVKEAGLTNLNDFVMNESVAELFQSYIKCVAERKNTYNGIRYKDDTTIMGWVLAEQIRCRDECSWEEGHIASWAHRTAKAMKEVDPNHLITVGTEGFYRDECSNGQTIGVNPDTWASWLGINSGIDHSSEYIDFIAFTYFPGSWGIQESGSVQITECDGKKQQFISGWFGAKILEAEILQKPLILFNGQPGSDETYEEFMGDVIGIIEENMINGSHKFMGVVLDNTEVQFGSKIFQEHSELVITNNLEITLGTRCATNTNQVLNRPSEMIESMLESLTCMVKEQLDRQKNECVQKAFADIQQTGLITVQDGFLQDDKCNKYNFVGLEMHNGYRFLQSSKLQEYLSTLKALGIKVIRMYAPVGMDDTVGVSDDKARRLDELLTYMAVLDMKIILYFASNYPLNFDNITRDDQGYPKMYAQTVLYFINEANKREGSPTLYRHDDFFVSTQIMELFQGYIADLITRTNYYTGRKYIDDPTILAWNIVDGASCGIEVDKCIVNNNFGKWLKNMTEFVKKHDPNHLVAGGTTGFYQNPCWRNANPTQWAAFKGPNAIHDDALSSVDYVGFSYYPDNWGVYQDVQYTKRWFNIKNRQAETLEKPLILQPFAKLLELQAGIQINITASREQLIMESYLFVFNIFEKSLKNNDTLQGVFWSDWDFDEGSVHEFRVATNSSTWMLIKGQINSLSEYLVTNYSAPGKCRGSFEIIGLKNSRVELETDPQTCCDLTCGAMIGYLVGKNYKKVDNHINSAQKCCAACLEDDECDGWTWCTCPLGCQLPDLNLSYQTHTCLLKDLVTPLFAQNLTNGEYGSWVSGIAMRDNSKAWEENEQGQLTRKFTYHSECQVAGVCGTHQQKCSDEQIQNNLMCPSESCNALQVNYQGTDLMPIDQNSAAPGVPVTTVEQCCKACEIHQQCNVFVFCNSPFGCGTDRDCKPNLDFGRYRSCSAGQFPPWLCTLKYVNVSADKPLKITEAGDLQPWIAGYLDWKEVQFED